MLMKAQPEQLDVVTDGMSKMSSRFQLHKRSSQTIGQGSVEEIVKEDQVDAQKTQESTISGKGFTPRKASIELQPHLLPRIDIKHQGAEGQDKKVDRMKGKMLSQNIPGTSSA